MEITVSFVLMASLIKCDESISKPCDRIRGKFAVAAEYGQSILTVAADESKLSETVTGSEPFFQWEFCLVNLYPNAFQMHSAVISSIQGLLIVFSCMDVSRIYPSTR